MQSLTTRLCVQSANTIFHISFSLSKYSALVAHLVECWTCGWKVLVWNLGFKHPFETISQVPSCCLSDEHKSEAPSQPYGAKLLKSIFSYQQVTNQ